MSGKHKKVYIVLNYIEHLLILIFTAAGFISRSSFAALVGMRIGITSSIGYRIRIKNLCNKCRN